MNITQIVTQTKVVLRYDKRDEQGARVIDAYVMLDPSSGGYPSPTHISQAYDFKTVEAAHQYAYKFNAPSTYDLNLAVCVADITYRVTPVKELQP